MEEESALGAWAVPAFVCGLRCGLTGSKGFGYAIPGGGGDSMGNRTMESRLGPSPPQAGGVAPDRADEGERDEDRNGHALPRPGYFGITISQALVDRIQGRHVEEDEQQAEIPREDQLNQHHLGPYNYYVDGNENDRNISLLEAERARERAIEKEISASLLSRFDRIVETYSDENNKYTSGSPGNATQTEAKIVESSLARCSQERNACMKCLRENKVDCGKLMDTYAKCISKSRETQTAQ